MSVNKSLLLVRAAELATIAVRGADRMSWLNGLLTCNLAKLLPGEAAYGLSVTQKGRIQADVTLFVDEDQVLLAIPATMRDELVAAFDRYLVMEDAEMQSEPFVVWRAHGPRAGELVETMKSVEGARVAPLDFTGLGGAVVFAAEADAPRIESALSRVTGELGGSVGDDAAWERLRLERAIPRFGADFDKTTYPQEAVLERRAVSFDKGCYLGQEVVCMLELRGHVKRKLVPLSLSAGDAPPKGAEVHDAAGNKVGEITSSVAIPEGGAMALAMVKVSALSPEARVLVGAAEARISGGDPSLPSG
jgi:folate-binding protein YgfZ